MDQAEAVFSINSVIKGLQDDSEHRVIWAEKDGECYCINLAKAENVPQCFSYNDIVNGLNEGKYALVGDTWFVHRNPADITSKAEQRKEWAWNIIRDIVKKEPDVYDSSLRAKMLREAEARTGVKTNNIYKYLGAYWRGGKTEDALYPFYKNRGRGSYYNNPNAKSPGRARPDGAVGKALTPKDIEIFEKGIREFYLTRDKQSLNKAYQDMLAKYYTARDAQGNRIDLKANDIPSFYQFKHYYYAHRDPEESEKKRNGETHYNLNHRPILNQTSSYVFGPGDAVQIDATMADYYLVQQGNRGKIAGRPTVYFVIDAASHMVAGVHITFEPPSWNDALAAILNCSEDKVQYCKKFGITITPEDWPCRFIPNRLIADRGEVESRAADTIVSKLGITIDNTVPYRGDFKGIVEQHFHLMNVGLPKGTPGRVQPDFGERGARDYRLDAKLDIQQFSKMILLETLMYNNNKWMDSFVRTPSMRTYGIKSIPRDIWNHEMRYSSGVLRTLPIQKIRYMVLPQDTATVTRKGIRFHELMYTSEDEAIQKWFATVDITGAKKITVSFSPIDAAFIYVMLGDRIVECHLTKYHEMYCGIHTKEVNAYFKDDKDLKAAHQIDEINSQQKLNEEIHAIIDEATQMAPDRTGQTKASVIREIQENKRQEIEACRDLNTRKSLEAAGLLPENPKNDNTDSPQQNLGTDNTTTGDTASHDGETQTEGAVFADPLEQLLRDSLRKKLAEEAGNTDATDAV